MTKKSFIVSHRGALGDFLLTWPALIALRRKFKHHRFIGLGRPEYLELGKTFGLFDEILDCESKELLAFYSGKELPASLKPVDIALCWMKEDPDFLIFLKTNGIRLICLHPPFPLKSKKHVLDYHLEVLHQFSIPIPSQNDLYLPLSSQKRQQTVIHPGSGSDEKNFQPEFYTFIANELKNINFSDIRILIGPREKAIKNVFQDTFKIIEPVNITELASTLSGLNFFIGNDSGVTHLSAFLGVRTLALFKSTDPAMWGVKGLNAKNIKAVSEEQAMAKIQRALATG
jgi:ADP-heptose:LPS heptosyltransferase